MKNFNVNNGNNFSILKKRIEEKLKIIESQRQEIKRKKKRKLLLRNLIVSVFLIFITTLFVFGYKSFKKKSILKASDVQTKILIIKDKKFRDSISLLAINIELENKAYKKLMDSIRIEVDKKFDSINTLPVDNKKITKRKKFKRKSYRSKVKNKHIRYTTADDIVNFLKEEKENDANLKNNVGKENDIVSSQKTLESNKNESVIIKTYAIFPGCESKSIKKSCFDKKIKKFVKKKFNKKLFKKSGVDKINVLFTIAKNGLIKILSIKGAINEIIKNEVIRVIKTLPRFKPAINVNGLKIPINYHLTISF
jgi:hypothetical protein